MDDIAEQRRFSDRYGASFNLLADTTGSLVEAFSVGLDEKGLPERDAFVLRNGRVIWHTEKASTTTIAIDLWEVITGVNPGLPPVETQGIEVY